VARTSPRTGARARRALTRHRWIATVPAVVAALASSVPRRWPHASAPRFLGASGFARRGMQVLRRPCLQVFGPVPDTTVADAHEGWPAAAVSAYLQKTWRQADQAGGFALRNENPIVHNPPWQAARSTVSKQTYEQVIYLLICFLCQFMRAISIVHATRGNLVKNRTSVHAENSKCHVRKGFLPGMSILTRPATVGGALPSATTAGHRGAGSCSARCHSPPVPFV
jgi:hypothetical protein